MLRTTQAERKAAVRKQKLNFKRFSSLCQNVCRAAVRTVLRYVIFWPTVFPICLHKETCNKRKFSVSSWICRFTADSAVGIVFTLNIGGAAVVTDVYADVVVVIVKLKLYFGFVYFYAPENTNFNSNP